MRILITGGAGFIGSHIRDKFAGNGTKVLIIDDLSTGVRENLASSDELVKVDIIDPQCRKILQEFKPNVIIHAAAQISVRRSMEDPYFDTQVNVVGLVNLLQGLTAQSTHFVFISTGGAIYGEQDYYPAREDHPVRPTSAYGLAKRVGEQYLDLWSRENGLRVTALRLSNVYGPRQNPHGEAGVVAIFLERLLEGEVAVINGGGDQTRDFIYVEDVANAVHRVCTEGVTGIYNIGTGIETSINEIYRHIAESIGVSQSPRYGAAKPGEQMRSCIDPALAASKFDWRPQITLEEGIRKTAEWFKAKRDTPQSVANL